MSKTLKQKNKSQLVTFAIVNVIVLGVFELGPQKLLTLANSIAKGDWAMLGKLIAVPAVAALILGMIGWAVPRDWKETLIFWRLGDRCLPSSRAFSAIALSDARIDAKKLHDLIGDFPVEPAKQTAIWYGIYRQHTAEPAVEDAHGAYLLYREMIGLVAASLAAVVVAAITLHLGYRPTILASIFLVAEYLIVMVAGRHSGEHLVANVLAIASASNLGQQTPKRGPRNQVRSKRKSTAENGG